MNNNQDNEDKIGSYPYCSLASALEIGDVTRNLSGGKAAVSKSLLASALKEDERSATLRFKIASARNFGIIEGRSSFTLSHMAKRYYFPTGPQDRTSSLLAFLETPRAFKIISDRFDGSRIPEREHLANIFHREGGVPESWKDRVAGFFLQSAKFAGAIDDENHLRLQAARDGFVANPLETSDNGPVNEILDETHREEAPVPGIARVQGRANPSETFTVTRHDEDGKAKTVYAEVPQDLSMSLWNLLETWVQSVKPKE